METQRTLMRSLAIVAIASVIWTITEASSEKVKVCCTSVSTVEVTDTIIGVRMQNQSLPCVRAIIFETERGDFCSNPRQPWVRRKVKEFFRTFKINQMASTPPATSMPPVTSSPLPTSTPPLTSMPPPISSISELTNVTVSV